MEGPSPQHILAYATARTSSARIRRVILVGNIDAWSTIILGGISFLGSILTLGWAGAALGAAMCVLGWRQLQTTRKLRRLDLDAPRQLAINQLLLCLAVCLYSAWSLYAELSSPGELDTAMKQDPQLAQMIGSFAGMESTIAITIYTGVIVGSIIVMGSTAWYYYKKSDALNLYIQQTPDWLVQTQRTTDPL